MGIYGLEEQFWIGDYQFEVGFSNDNDVGLSQRDVYLGKRRKVEDLALADFTGLQLLQAYRGPDAEHRRQVYRQLREACIASYQAARRAPGAHSARLLRHEKRDKSRLERTLAEELAGLDRACFDLTQVAEQVEHIEQHHFLRSFYFAEVHDRYIHNFCRKYATDPTYRATVDQGTAPWQERNALFVKNLTSHLWREREGGLSSEEEDDDEREAFLEEQYFQWICQHAKAILADPAYQQLRVQERASEHACTQGMVDPAMQDVIAAWSALPGVVVSRSCQGAAGVFRFEEQTLLAPSEHEERTMMLVEMASTRTIEAVSSVVAAFPRLCLEPRGPFSEGREMLAHLHSESALSNQAARGDLVCVAERLKERVHG